MLQKMPLQQTSLKVIQVLLVSSILILSINLLKKRYTSILLIAMDHMLVDLLTKNLGVKLFVNK